MGYSFESRVRYSEIGADNKLTLLSLLDYFQDCSTFHGEAVGRSLFTLQEESLAWLLSSWQIVVERFPLLGEKIRISTWSYKIRSVFGYRNFLMEDAQGKRIAYANSLWAFTDTKEGRAVRVPEREIVAYAPEEMLDMDYAPRKIAISGEGKSRPPIHVMRHHIDTNNHVNNGQYVMMGEEYLPEEFEVRQMRAEYKNAAVLDDIIIPVVYENGDLCTISLNDENEKPYCVVEFARKA